MNQVEVDYYENDNLNRQEQIDKYLVWLEIQQVVDPSSVIASAAHQLCRNKLVAERLISATEADLPYLADLASVFFGVGVVLANYSLHEQYWHQHHYGDWIIGRNTHLSMNEFGYAFGLLARVREEEKPSWLSHLRLDIRKACKKTMNWLEHQPPLQNLTSVPYPENPVKDSNHFKPSDTDRACVYCDEPIHESVSRTHSRVCANCQASIEESDAEHSSSASIEFSKLSEAYTWAIIAVVVLACIILMTVGFHG
ncbi:MAG TPA: hypothetical protein PKA06_14575 [Gemmatales bacterium]|nr:hypothetical protein [Gemmatales bacterium]